MFAELYYIGTSDMPARPSEYHQNDDVAETVAEIPFVASTEIGNSASKYHQLFQDTALWYDFFYYICGVIELIRVNRTSMVKWLHFLT